jgi:hypothetical protein
METARNTLINEIKLRLGSGMIDVELDPEHFDYSITAAIDRYRQRSGNSIQESFVFLDAQPDVSTYTLPDEVQEVITVYRRTIGGSGGSSIDPFSLAFVNNIYMIQNPGSLGGSGAGTLATYDFAMQFQKLAGRMFGRDVMFTWDPVSKKITFHRRMPAVEEICLHVYNARPDEVLLMDYAAKPWLRDYATAMCKLMMGEARSKFQSFGGPQGGVTMNGDALKSEAKEEMDRLELEIQQLVDGRSGWPFVIG